METGLAQRIRIARESKDMELDSLSRRLSVSTRILRQWESGQESPDAEHLRRLARQVGVEAHLEEHRR